MVWSKCLVRIFSEKTFSSNQRWANDSVFRGIPYSIFRFPRNARGTENEIEKSRNSAEFRAIHGMESMRDSAEFRRINGTEFGIEFLE